MTTARTNLFLASLAFSLAACTATHTSAPPNADSAIIMRTAPVRAWELREDGHVVGSLVRYETPGDAQKSYFSVRNRHQQEIGIVDLAGRAWRYRPHQREPDWLCTGTILEGARLVLGAGKELVEVPLQNVSHGVARND
jgi:hypothetical protein